MIYKLNYTDKQTAIADLIAKGIYNEDLSYKKGVQAVVEIGKVVKEYATFDKDFKEVTQTIYYDGYSFDVMCEQKIIFETEIFPKNSKHCFAGIIQ
jgi:hypothetical protein